MPPTAVVACAVADQSSLKAAMTATGDGLTMAGLAAREVREAGALGPCGYQVLLLVTKARVRSFPTLLSDEGWEVEDAAHEFWADKGKAFLTDVVLREVDGEGYRRLLARYLKRWLIDKVRDTDRGSVRHRLEQRMTDEPEFKPSEALSHFWQILAPPDDAWDGDFARVLEAMRAVHTGPPPRWGHEGVRLAIAEAHELVAVLCAMFTAAAGSVHIAEVTTLVMDRFTHTYTPIDDLDDLAEVDEPTGDVQVRTQTEAAAVALLDAPGLAAAAEYVWESLAVEDREAIPVLGDIPALCAMWGVPRGVAYRRRTKVYKEIVTRCGEAGDAGSVASVVVDRAVREHAGRNSGELVRLEPMQGFVEAQEGQS